MTATSSAMTFKEELLSFRDSLEQALAGRVETLLKEEARLRCLCQQELIANEYPVHVATLGAFLDKLHLYVAKCQYYLVPHSLLQYTISTKRRTLPKKGFHTVYNPGDSVMTPTDMSIALALICYPDENLAYSLLSLSARKSGFVSLTNVISELSAIDDSHCTPEEALQKKSHVLDPYCLSLQGEQALNLSDSLRATSDALLFFKDDLSALDYYISSCSFIHDDFYMEPIEYFGDISEYHPASPLVLTQYGTENPAFDVAFRSDVALLKKLVPEDEYKTIRCVTRLHHYHIVLDTPYIEPDFTSSRDYLPALKEPLRDLTKILKISMITADFGCIDEKDIPLFFFRLCGNCRPENLRPITWHTLDNKNDPKQHRGPNELFFLLHHMFEGTRAENSERIFRFFTFEPEIIQTRVSAILQPGAKTGTAQYATSARREFKRLLHDVVDEDVFPDIP
jgi:hypothetical protein